MSDVEAIAQARVGTTLRGKYRLDRLLGVGGMAAVYAATQQRVGHRVALKVLHPHMSLNADVRARFLREGYVANTVEHRSAVRVTDDDTAEDGSVFLAMELLEGETLDARWQRSGGRLPVREVLELAHQLLDVLAAAHEKGIVHRDIKPENLFLTREGVLKVLDFGIARLATSGAQPDGRNSATRTGRMLGSPAFMAPEQALGRQRDIDGQTDLWSAGATMFTLITGQFVHDADTVEAVLIYAGSRPARPLGPVAPEVPAPIAAVVDRALASSKAERWASARTMEIALEAAYLETYGEAIPGARSAARVSKVALDKTAEVPVAPAAPASNPTAGATVHQPPGSVVAGAMPGAYPTVDSTERMFAPGRVASAQARVASTTAGIGPVTTRPSAAPPGRRSLYAMAGGIVLVGAGLIAATWATLGRGGAPPAAAVTPTSAQSPPISSPATTPPVATVVAAAVADAGTVSVLDLPVAKPVLTPGHAPTQAQATSRPSPLPVAAQSAPPPAPGPTPTPTVNCEPPTWTDAQGLVHLKQGCK